MSEGYNPLPLLVTEVQIAEWNTQGLPADPVSTENGVLVSMSARYPLLVDPQLQGVAWVRAMETPNGLETVRLGNADVIFKLKVAIENGLPLTLTLTLTLP